MNQEGIKIHSKQNEKITTKIYPGHYATSHSHVNYYIDMSAIKHQSIMARLVAHELAQPFQGISVDTIVCLDGNEITGAYLAEEIATTSILNKGVDISVITPEINQYNQMIFRDNTQRKIKNKKVLLLVENVTTGKTINRSLECITYYGGEAVGITSLFSMVDSVMELPVNTIFKLKDIEGYQAFVYADCPMCKNKQKIDALINSFGFSEI